MIPDKDTRLPVRFGRVSNAGAAEAVLVEDGADGTDVPPKAAATARFTVPAMPHAFGCACCLPRGSVSVALGRLFLASARGEVAPFTAVVAVTHSAAGAAAVKAALESDVLTRARFRLAADQRPDLAADPIAAMAVLANANNPRS